MKKIFLLVILLISFQVRAESLVPVEVMDINKSLWGLELANAAKGLPVAYDSKNDLLYSGAITSSNVMVTSPSENHPKEFIDLQTEHAGVSNLFVDVKRRRLIWVSRQDESIRIVDLDSRKVIGQKSGVKASAPFPVKDAQYSEETGILWVANPATHTLTGYHLDLSSEVIAGASSVTSVAVSGKWVYYIDSPQKNEANLYQYDSETKQSKVIKTFAAPQRPPRLVRTLNDGTLLLVSNTIIALDENLNEKWKAKLDESPESVVQVGSHLVCVQNKYEHHHSLVAILDAATGTQKAVLEARLEGKWSAADTQHNRVYIGNGGDGSVTVINLAELKVEKNIDVANAAEGVVIDSKTGNRFIRNRLGGSELYLWKPGATDLTRIEGGNWPLEIFIDSDARLLYSVSFYDSQIDMWNCDTLERLTSIPLNVPDNTGDALGDIDVDPQSHLLGFVFPESGSVGVVDLEKKSVLWTKKIDGLQVEPEAGPGRGMAGIDSKKLYVFNPQKEELISFDVQTGSEIKKVTLDVPHKMHKEKKGGEKKGKKGKQGNKKKKGQGGQGPMPSKGEGKIKGGHDKNYKLDLLYVDRINKRIFLRGQVIDSETLEVKSMLPQVHKIFYAGSDRVLGMWVGPTGQETLVELDAKTLEARHRYEVMVTPTIHSDPHYDPLTKKVYFSELARARVSVYQLP